MPKHVTEVAFCPRRMDGKWAVRSSYCVHQPGLTREAHKFIRGVRIYTATAAQVADVLPSGSSSALSSLIRCRKFMPQLDGVRCQVGVWRDTS